ncbi:hypothetical protein H0G86_011869 [Trichoderma simmonsii]|uniref:Uncharacterized protein n=1 Tax=Trichoderma simmonsii TaxID=1491479 RepID=A0A8G0LMY0_9HYPO|nr:hypothetical protein H0G86_011869 [Trichoderma simmonsii]
MSTIAVEVDFFIISIAVGLREGYVILPKKFGLDKYWSPTPTKSTKFNINHEVRKFQRHGGNPVIWHEQFKSNDFVRYDVSKEDMREMLCKVVGNMARQSGNGNKSNNFPLDYYIQCI